MASGRQSNRLCITGMVTHFVIACHSDGRTDLGQQCAATDCTVDRIIFCSTAETSPMTSGSSSPHDAGSFCNERALRRKLKGNAVANICGLRNGLAASISTHHQQTGVAARRTGVRSERAFDGLDMLTNVRVGQEEYERLAWERKELPCEILHGGE
eukprot:363896-Chlamydomonas_euryale.AAC.6